MSTAVVIVIVVVVVIALVALFVALPRMRQRAQIRGRERKLDERRDQVVTTHREEAAHRERRAEVAEQNAKVAEQEAQRERAAAQAREEQANLHERGLADHELISPDEREDFEGTSAVPEDGVACDAVPPDDSSRASEDGRGATERTRPR
jgi:FtsZ-interacting cell division protein ZipA